MTFCYFLVHFATLASLVAQLVKNPPAIWETWVRSLSWEDPLEKGKANLQYSGLENSMDCIVHGDTNIFTFTGFLGSSDDKQSACNAGDPGAIPGLERSLEKVEVNHPTFLGLPWCLKW